MKGSEALNTNRFRSYKSRTKCEVNLKAAAADGFMAVGRE